MRHTVKQCTSARLRAAAWLSGREFQPSTQSTRSAWHPIWRTAGNLTAEAHIAALAIEHGATVVTFDRDFERFGIRVQLPT